MVTCPKLRNVYKENGFADFKEILLQSHRSPVVSGPSTGKERIVDVLIAVQSIFFNPVPDVWLEVSHRKVLRPAISTQVLLGFPGSYSKCWDGSVFFSKLPLHASHVALP
jgi:hypothetical protein